MKLLIKNGKIIDPANNLNGIHDIMVENGKIVNIGNDLSSDDTEIIDAGGMWVVPGLIDLHVHLREPGFEGKETIASGSRAAARGGFTTICCMPNTNPVIDNEIIVEYINLKAAREAVVNVLPIGSITKGQNGQDLSNIGSMAKVGICAISEDGKTVENSLLLKTAMKYAAMFDIPVFSHCEDIHLVGKGQINAGQTSALLGLAGISNDSEDVIVSRDIILARGAQAKLHLCHVSTSGSVQLIRDAKSRDENVTAEATPHHFTLCDEDIIDYDANYKMNPPLRSRRDLKCIQKALKDDIIDVIATDHAPHHRDSKNCEFESAANGIIGLETAVSLTISELVNAGWITEKQFVEKLSLNPARILGIDKGTLSIGADADITIIDPVKKYVVDADLFASKSRNTPFNNREVTGSVEYTICGGKVVYAKGELI